MNGMTDKLTGKAKQVAGIASDDKKKEGEGKAQEAKGNMKQKASEAIDDAKRQADELKRMINNQ